MSLPARRSGSYGFTPGGALTECASTNSGVISDRPPSDTITSVRTPSNAAFFSIASKYLYPPAISVPFSGVSRQRRRHLVRLGLRNRNRDRLDEPRARRRGGVPQVPRHHDHAAQDEHAGEPAHHIEPLDGDQAVDEGIGERPVGASRAPHEALSDPRGPHGEYV